MKRLFCFLLLIVLVVFCFKTEGFSALKEVNVVTFFSKPIIIVDAGHGGFDGGAVKGNIIEKDINLRFALSLEPMLKAFGYKVLMTRTTDSSTEDAGLSTIRQKKVSDIKNRLSLIENNEIECFISLHQNMFSQSAYKGTQVFYSDNNASSEIYAKCIKENIQGLLQTENKREIKSCGKNIYLMYYTTKPAVLVECGFMSNYEELNLLLDENYRKKLNFCILNGVLKGGKIIKDG
ncbi:MAG: N-acetylmuramoyl-L-alanine amidase [Clostridia bacterium]|nr:N-acetylmuramoyl-L-alanine amidase [Clostridia bacterium]